MPCPPSNALPWGQSQAPRRTVLIAGGARSAILRALEPPPLVALADRVEGIALRTQILGVLVVSDMPAKRLQNVEGARVARVRALVAAQAKVSEGVSLEEQQGSLRLRGRRVAYRSEATTEGCSASSAARSVSRRPSPTPIG